MYTCVCRQVHIYLDISTVGFFFCLLQYIGVDNVRK